MREIKDIQKDIDIKKSELYSLENELHDAKNAKNSAFLIDTNEKYQNKWVLYYGKHYSMGGGPSTRNLNRMTFALIESVDKVYHDSCMATVSQLIEIDINDECRDPMHVNSNISIKKQFDTEWAFTPADVVVRSREDVLDEIERVKSFVRNSLLSIEVSDEA